MRGMECKTAYPDFFLPFESDIDMPIKAVWKDELAELMSEYRRITDYLDGIAEPWMRRMFEQRYIERMSFSEIGTAQGVNGGVVRQEIYGYLRTHPEGFTCTRDLAERWNVGVDAINHWCRLGLIPGAVKRKGDHSNGHQIWMIPADAQYPPNRRRCNYQKPRPRKK